MNEKDILTYFNAIASLGGNLPDERLNDRTGPNDARHRGLMYTEARRLAREAITKINEFGIAYPQEIR